MAAPLTNAKKITMVATGGEIGAAKITGEVMEVVSRLPLMVQNMTGFKMLDALKDASSKGQSSKFR